jgi:hypothetical protein
MWWTLVPDHRQCSGIPVGIFKEDEVRGSFKGKMMRIA